MDTKLTLQSGRADDISWKFFGLFTLYLGIFIGLAQVPRPFYETVSRFTAWAVAAFWTLFFFPISSSGTYVTFYDFTMEIILECTGLHYAAIFTAAVLAFQGRTLRYKTVGLFVGISIIFLMNLLRLGMLGLVGNYSASLFAFLHLYLWHALFTFFVLFLWVFWVNGKISISWLFTRQVTVVVAAAFLSFWIMFTYLDHYFSLLAYIADSVFPLFGGSISVPSQVIAEGKLLGYVSGDYVIYSKTGLYTLNLAVYIALVAVNVRASDRGLFVKRVMVGSGLMIFFHLCMLFMDWSLEVTDDDLLNSVLRWCIVLSSMVAPVVAWFSAALLVRSPVKHEKAGQ